MKKSDFKSTIIFSDGACTGNPGPGGWASVVVTPDGNVRELGGGSPETTNNRMEMMGALMGLKSLQVPHPYPVVLYTDSTYVIRGITQWIWGWRAKGWKNAEGKEVSNRDIWIELSRELMRLKPTEIDWKYVRGHTGVPGNERCDEISVAFANRKRIQLYQGPLLQYDVAIYDLPEDQGLPEMRPREKKPPAFSYLSYQGGVVRRHRDWASCERRVKGQSGAKFKKAMSAAEEPAILKSWGLGVGTAIVDE
jgi:ribonuclease HI